MADPKAVVRIGGTPRDMRPRATPNAEINAQRGDEFRYDQGVFERPEVKDVPPRGYRRGGKVYAEGGSVGDPLATSVNRATAESRGGRPYSTFLQEPQLNELAPKSSTARQQRHFDAQMRRVDEDTNKIGSDMAAERKQMGYNKGGKVNAYCKGGKVISSKQW